MLSFRYGLGLIAVGLLTGPRSAWAQAVQYVASENATINLGQSFTPTIQNVQPGVTTLPAPLGPGSGQFQWCVSGQTNFDGGGSSHTGTNLGDASSPNWSPSWTPTAAGPYTFYIAADGNASYQPANPGLNGLFYSLTVNGPSNGITWTSVNMPTYGMPGQTITFTATVNNSGGTVWTNNYCLEMDAPAGNGVSFPSIAGVNPGGSISPTFTVTLPTTPGNYTYSFVAQQENVQYFGPRVFATIGVISPKTAQSVTSQAAAVYVGQPFTPVFNPGGPGSGAYQFCVVNNTNFDGGASSYVGTNLGPSPGYSPQAQWVPAWTATPAGSYTFDVAEDENATYEAANPGTQGISYPLSVANRPTVSIAASNPSIQMGQTTRITANFVTDSAHGDSLLATAIEQPSGTIVAGPSSGNLIYTFSPTATGTYTFAAFAQTAIAPGWTSYASCTVTVSAAPPAAQSISFPNPGVQVSGEAPFYLEATDTSGLPITYTVTGPATVSGSVLTITGTGTVTVTASQPGNAGYQAAPRVTDTFTVVAPSPASADTFQYDSAGRLTQVAQATGLTHAFSYDAEANVLSASSSGADTANVGIPDWWQNYYFGTKGVSATTSFAGDGISNLLKYETGQDPLFASSSALASVQYQVLPDGNQYPYITYVCLKSAAALLVVQQSFNGGPWVSGPAYFTQVSATDLGDETELIVVRCLTPLPAAAQLAFRLAAQNAATGVPSYYAFTNLRPDSDVPLPPWSHAALAVLLALAGGWLLAGRARNQPGRLR